MNNDSIIDEKKLPSKLYEKLSKDEINSLDIVAYKGPIHVICSQQDMLNAVNELSKEEILGFDTETRPSFKKGEFYKPAMLQLAGKDAVYLFRLTDIELSSELIAILKNPGIIKAGVAIGRDIKELQDLVSFEPGGFVDLGACAERNNIPHHGLRGLAALLLEQRISKGGQLTNWERPNLNQAALVYAATDAWIGREIYLKMKKLSIKMKPVSFNNKEPKKKI